MEAYGTNNWRSNTFHNSLLNNLGTLSIDLPFFKFVKTIIREYFTILALPPTWTRIKFYIVSWILFQFIPSPSRSRNIHHKNQPFAIFCNWLPLPLLLGSLPLILPSPHYILGCLLNFGSLSSTLMDSWNVI